MIDSKSLQPTPPEMSTEDAVAFIQNTARMAMLIRVEDVQAVLTEINRTNTLMPLLDPTGYREIVDNIPRHTQIVRAFLDFRKKLDEVLQADLKRQGKG